MASRFASTLLFSLLIVAASFRSIIAAAAGGTAEESDPVIRQVVDHGQGEALDDHHHFTIFKKNFGKTYADKEEHDHRFSIFKANLRRARSHQKIDPSAVHGVTQFSDLTPREFRRQFLGLNRRLRFPSDAQKADILPTNDLPTDFDWRDRDVVTSVKNQGSCGSCWSFSTAGALEGANFLATGDLVSLSEQQLVDCDHECDPEEKDSCDSGCNGGLMNSAFEYTLKFGRLMKEEDYPYTGTDRGSWKLEKSKIAAKVANFSVVSLDEDQIAANLVKNGHLAVAINAVFMQTYIKGVSCPYICSPNRLDHGVLLVGYGSDGYAPVRMKGKPSWIIKNSWGETWGEKGYYKICRGHNIYGGGLDGFDSSRDNDGIGIDLAREPASGNLLTMFGHESQSVNWMAERARGEGARLTCGMTHDSAMHRSF